MSKKYGNTDLLIPKIEEEKEDMSFVSSPGYSNKPLPSLSNLQNSPQPKSYFLQRTKMFSLQINDLNDSLKNYLEINNVEIYMNIDGKNKVVMKIETDDSSFLSLSRSKNSHKSASFFSLDISEKHEFHFSNSITKYTCMPKEELQNYPKLKGSKHILIIQNRETQERVLLVFQPMIRSNINKHFLSILKNLIFFSRYSEIGLKAHLENRFSNLIYHAFKEALSYAAKIINIQCCSRFTDCLTLFETLIESGRTDELKRALETLRPELRAIMYRKVLYEGVFPFKFEFNTMNSSAFSSFFKNWLAPRSILPWGPDFHCSMNIGKIRYSFVNMGEVQNHEERHYNKTFEYYQLTILDFFPKNEWIEAFSRELETLVCLEFILSLSKTHHLLGLDDKMVVFGDLREIEYDHFQTLDQEKNTGNFHTRHFIRKCIKQEIKQIILEKISRETCVFVAENLIEIHKNQFYKGKFFKKICKVIAETELRQYSLCENNCQTPVSEVIFITTSVFGEFIESLIRDEDLINMIRNNGPTNQVENKKKAKKFEEYFKFASSPIKNVFAKQKVFPCELTTRLDFFCYFGDDLLKKRMGEFTKEGSRQAHAKPQRKIFKTQSNEAFQDILDGIGKIERLSSNQQSFYHSIKTSVFQEYCKFFGVFSLSEYESPLKDFSTNRPSNLDSMSPSLDSKKISDLKNERGSESHQTSKRESNLDLFFKGINLTDANPSRSSVCGSNLTKERQQTQERSRRNLLKAIFYPSKSEPKNREEIPMNYMAYLLFKHKTHYLSLQKIKDSIERDSSLSPEDFERRLQENREQKFWTRIIINELLFFYFNSIRAKMVGKTRDDITSYVGYVLVKEKPDRE